MPNQTKVARLNQLGEEWSAAKKRGDDGIAQAGEIYSLALKIYGEAYFAHHVSSELKRLTYVDPSSVITEFYIRDFNRFDPEKGSLYSYMNWMLPKRYFDVVCVDDGGEVKTIKDEKTKTKKRVLIPNRSIYDKSGDEEDAPLLIDTDIVLRWATVSTELHEVPEDDDQSNYALYYHLLAVMLNLPERLHGRANNPTRLNYFRMFYTDDMTMLLRGERDERLQPYQFKERELFAAAHLLFLDFYSRDIYRSIPEVAFGHFKLYSELVNGRPNEEPKKVFDDIYLSYFEREEKHSIVPGALSNQRAAYKKFMAELIKEFWDDQGEKIPMS